MKEYIRILFLTRPFSEDDPINGIAKENLQAYREFVNEMKNRKLTEKIRDLYNMQTCFIHGDTHFKSIFVKDGKTAVC